MRTRSLRRSRASWIASRRGLAAEKPFSGHCLEHGVAGYNTADEGDGLPGVNRFVLEFHHIAAWIAAAGVREHRLAFDAAYCESVLSTVSHLDRDEIANVDAGEGRGGGTARHGNWPHGSAAG